MKKVCLSCVLACASVCQAQFGRGDSSWAAGGADAQRSSWVRNDSKISKEGVQKPDFKFLWKLKISEKAGPVSSLTPALLLTKYIGYRGFRDLAIVQSSGNSTYGIDADLGRIEWQNHAKESGGSCKNETIAGLARPTVTTFPAPPVVFGRGRGGPAHSGVGQENEGAVTLAEAGALRRPPPATPAVAPGAAPVVPPKRSPIVIYALSSSGMLHTMYISNGVEEEAPIEFVATNVAARGFIVLNNTAYVATSDCGAGGNGVRALDLTTKQSAKWDASSEIAGSDGPAFGPDGTVYAATTGGDLVALDSKTLQVKSTYHAGTGFVSSPVVFEYRNRVLAVAATKDGTLHLLDTKSIETPLNKTAGGNVAGALASWQDPGGRRWILAPVSSGAIATWQIQDNNGTLSLAPGWTSRAIANPAVPMIVNGVVFAASRSGKTTHSPAVIYALDGADGKELWSSGKAIGSSAQHGSLSAGNSQIYLGTDDGYLYSFGSWIERQ